MVTFTPLQKMKKLSQFLKLTSWKYLAQFSWNLGCGILTVEGISTAKIAWFRISSMKLCIHENCIIVLPVNILTSVVRRFLGRTKHYRVSWWLLNPRVTITLQEEWHQVFLCLNAPPNYQLYTEKQGGHYASFGAMLHSLHSITNVQKTSI